MSGLSLGLMGSSLFSGCLTDSFKGDPLIRFPEWTGDSFGPMHRIRDREAFPIPKPSEKVNVVVIGGGLSGLTSAYKLRNESFLLLERETALGGNAKEGVYQGIPYALGSAYLVDRDPPYGPFYDELGLTLEPVTSPTDSALLGGQWASLESGSMAQEFQRLKQRMSQMLKSPDFPSTPLHEATETAMKLDKLSFYDYLKADTSPELIRCIDAYCYSALGGSVHEISAYAGVNFYSEIAGDIYAFPGGNAYIAKRLVKHINTAGAGRLRTGVSVYHLEQKGKYAYVSYFLNDSPSVCRTVQCKAVVLAVPYFFAGRILEGLSDEQQTLIKSMQYGSYLVANCCFEGRPFTGSYDNWTPLNPTFTDFVTADHVSGGSNTNPHASVLTVYAPFRNTLAGRIALLKGDRNDLGGKIAEALKNSIGYPAGSLKEIRLTRYGHQLLKSRVGLMQSLSTLQKVYGRVVLSHSDGQGMAAIESAVLEGLTAARKVKSILSS
jgi:hypothetical protein